MLVTKLAFHIDFKHKTFHIYHENGESEKVVINNEGGGELILDMFKSVDVGALKGLIADLNEVLDKSQVQGVLHLWGNSNAIKLSTVTDILNGDRVLAKHILRIGIIRGVLATGVNSTWKVVNKEEQKTMKEHADRMKRGPIHNAPEYQESVAKLTKQGFTIGEAKEKETVEGEGVLTTVLPKKRKEVAVEQGVEIIPEEPLVKVDNSKAKTELRLKLQALEHKAKTFTEWDELVTPWTVNNEIKAIKEQLRSIEIAQDKKTYIQQVNQVNPVVPLPKSITRIVSPALSSKHAKILPKKK